MAKEDQMIMTVERDVLFNYNKDYFNGFQMTGEVDFESRILANSLLLRRGKNGDLALGKISAEENPTFKQPIGYALVINPELKKVFAYKRASKDENYAEKRLYGKWSWGVGGHIEGSDSLNPIRGSMKREIEEEIQMNGKIYDIKPLGYINDDSNSIGSVHFGILYAALTDSTEVKPTDEHEIDMGELMTISQLEEIMMAPDCDVETWSQIAMTPLKKYLI